MNPLFCRRGSRFRPRAVGAVLLALPWCGIALPLAPASAQTAAPPVTNPPAAKLGVSPLSAEEKARVDKFIALAHFETICKTQLDLKVENASVETVIKRIQDNFPTQVIPIEARGLAATALSFDIKEKNVGALLQTVADRTGSNLYVLSSGLLLAPASQLTDTERADVARDEGGEWAKNMRGSDRQSSPVTTGNATVSATSIFGHAWSSRMSGQSLFYTAIAREATGSPAQSPLLPFNAKTTWDAFSPDSQAMLQQVAEWCDYLPWFLHPGSPVEVNTIDQKHVTITFRPGANDSNRGSISTSFNLRSINPQGKNP